MTNSLSVRHASVLVFLLALGAGAGCSSAGDEGAGARGDRPAVAATSDFALRSDLARLDAPAWDALVVPHEGREIWLRPDARDAAFLRPGAVTLIAGRGVLKPGAVRDEGDHLVVENTRADFGEVIENGTLGIEGAVRFDQPFDDGDDPDLGVLEIDGTAPPAQAGDGGGDAKPASLRPLGGSLVDQAKKDLYSGLEKLLSDGWTMTKSVKGEGDALRYEITLTKDSGGLLARLHLTGTVNNLETALRVAVRNHVTEKQAFDVRTSGEADLTYEIGIRDGSIGYKKLVLPGVAYKQAFFLGEVPMVLRVKSGFSVVLAATGRNTTTTGRVHVTWSNDGGIAVTPADAASSADGNGEVSFFDDMGGMIVAPSAFSVAATLPRVEIGMGMDKLFVAGGFFANTSSTYIESRGGIGLDPCAHIDTKLEGKVGMFLDAGTLGSKLTGALDLTEDKLSRKLYEQEKKAVSCGLK